MLTPDRQTGAYNIRLCILELLAAIYPSASLQEQWAPTCNAKLAVSPVTSSSVYDFGHSHAHPHELRVTYHSVVSN